MILLETDAPDLMVSTPGGRLAVVECTSRVADVALKLGKLVDRRGAVSKAISVSGHAAQILAVLVCRLPRDQIAAHEPDLRAQKVLLVSGDEVLRGFEGVRHAADPDVSFERALTTVGEGSSVSQ